VGSAIAFGLARRYGAALVIRYGNRIGLDRRHLDLAERFFGRFGIVAVFIGRLLPVVRTYISFPAGLSRMGWAPFLLATAAGCVPWNLALAGAGLLLGRRYGLVDRALGPLVLPVAVAVVVLLGVAYVLGRRAGARHANG